MTNILTELLPRKVRLVLYLIVAIALLAFGAWQAADGNVLEAVVGFLTSLAPLLAASNINPPDPGVDVGAVVAQADSDILVNELAVRGPSGLPVSTATSGQTALWSPDTGSPASRATPVTWSPEAPAQGLTG